jgi:protein O-GlcNAc transferase
MVNMKPGRNDPCPCGSGKKYKHCCEGKVAAAPRSPPPAEIDPLIALYNAGRYAELENRALLLVDRFPDFGFGWKLLGGALQMQGKDALPAFQKTAELMPNEADAHYNLGVVLSDLGKLDDAVAEYRRAAKIKPDFAEAHNNLGYLLHTLGQPDAALASCRRAIELKPDYAEAHNNLGNALKDLGKLDEAVSSYRRAIRLKPDFALAHSNLGHALQVLGNPDAALASCRRAIELKPDFAEAYNNLGNAQNELGDSNAALVSYRRAVEIRPDFVSAQSNLLFALSYSASHTHSYYLEQAHHYGRIVTEKAGEQFTSWQCSPSPIRLRVGLVSGDMRRHPVGYFLENLLTHIDPACIELIAYPTHHEEDELTARIRPYFSAWKPLFGKDDKAAAQQIRADGVHILIDLAGHTTYNRLPVFAWKPAPVQVSWLGYFATTGVAEMDYLLADKVGIPETQRKQVTESVWYLPDTRLCFTAPKVNLSVASLPALQKGYVTLGCFQKLPKIGSEVLKAWGKIFSGLLDAELRVQSTQLGEPVQAKQLLARLQHHGINPARVVMQGRMHYEKYLAAHAEVDIILDTFPYPGGTTTCEALWMGVPTLTLAGDSLLSRQGASLLTAAGMEEWVATSKEEYIFKAIALANDVPKLASLRASLRQQVLASPLFDAPRFARNFENALWGMWKERAQIILPTQSMK